MALGDLQEFYIFTSYNKQKIKKTRYCKDLGAYASFLRQIQFCHKQLGIYFKPTLVRQCELTFLSKKEKRSS